MSKLGNIVIRIYKETSARREPRVSATTKAKIKLVTQDVLKNVRIRVDELLKEKGR